MKNWTKRIGVGLSLLVLSVSAQAFAETQIGDKQYDEKGFQQVLAECQRLDEVRRGLNAYPMAASSPIAEQQKLENAKKMRELLCDKVFVENNERVKSTAKLAADAEAVAEAEAAKKKNKPLVFGALNAPCADSLCAEGLVCVDNKCVPRKLDEEKEKGKVLAHCREISDPRGQCDEKLTCVSIGGDFFCDLLLTPATPAQSEPSPAPLTTQAPPAQAEQAPQASPGTGWLHNQRHLFETERKRKAMLSIELDLANIGLVGSKLGNGFTGGNTGFTLGIYFRTGTLIRPFFKTGLKIYSISTSSSSTVDGAAAAWDFLFGLDLRGARSAGGLVALSVPVGFMISAKSMIGSQLTWEDGTRAFYEGANEYKGFGGLRLVVADHFTFDASVSLGGGRVNPLNELTGPQSKLKGGIGISAGVQL